MQDFLAEWYPLVLDAKKRLDAARKRKSEATGNYPENWDTLETNLTSGLYFEDPELLTGTIDKIKAL